MDAGVNPFAFALPAVTSDKTVNHETGRRAVDRQEARPEEEIILAVAST